MRDIDVIPPNPDRDITAEIAALADRYRRANGPAMRAITMLGTHAESTLERLPDGVRARLTDATTAALRAAMQAAHHSRRAAPPQGARRNRHIAAAMGAIGGAGGGVTALAELPMTITMLLRAIQEVAEEYGFDPAEESVRFDCIEVFAAAGPFAEDDGAELAFVSSRITVSGAALQGVLARVAPTLAQAMGQKLAAQMVPVLGAVAGASINMAYMRYYQEMAHVHFGLRRLGIEADVAREDLVEDLRAALVRSKLR